MALVLKHWCSKHVLLDVGDALGLVVTATEDEAAVVSSVDSVVAASICLQTSMPVLNTRTCPASAPLLSFKGDPIASEVPSALRLMAKPFASFSCWPLMSF